MMSGHKGKARDNEYPNSMIPIRQANMHRMSTAHKLIVQMILEGKKDFVAPQLTVWRQRFIFIVF